MLYITHLTPVVQWHPPREYVCYPVCLQLSGYFFFLWEYYPCRSGRLPRNSRFHVFSSGIPHGPWGKGFLYQEIAEMQNVFADTVFQEEAFSDVLYFHASEHFHILSMQKAEDYRLYGSRTVSPPEVPDGADGEELPRHAILYKSSAKIPLPENDPGHICRKVP